MRSCATESWLKILSDFTNFNLWKGVTMMGHIESALKVLDEHISALNARDPSATQHFPHFRLSGTGLKEWPTPEIYFDDFKSRAGGDWSHSEFSDIKIVDSSQIKVHVDLEVLRYDTESQPIARFRSLWVLTYDQGRWVAKFRSSFAPK